MVEVDKATALWGPKEGAQGVLLLPWALYPAMAVG